MSGMEIDLSGKVALVTGGSRGIGMAIAMSMAEKGARVAISGRKQENLDRAAADFKERQLQVLAVAANGGQAGQVDSLFSVLDRELGGVDILVNNVGTNILTPSVAEADEALFDKLMETNLKSAFLASAQAIKRMKKTWRREDHQYQFDRSPQGGKGHGDLLCCKGGSGDAYQGAGAGVGP
ncbi:MAG: SDR family NAD(P)-dependent oxidoreductase [Desulfobacterales bacterium]|nr:SDR family NAD(P)-dependent oxidoreductase [Desulfobacterales bacterium]